MLFAMRFEATELKIFVDVPDGMGKSTYNGKIEYEMFSLVLDVHIVFFFYIFCSISLYIAFFDINNLQK